MFVKNWKIALGLLALAAQAQAADITVEHVKARASMPGTSNSAAFMNIYNNGDQPVSIISAESEVARAVELHTHKMHDGKMSMRRVPSIELPANSKVELKPGGLHVMLIGLHQPLEEGTQFDLSLLLSDGDRVDLKPEVKNIMKAMKH